MFTRKQCLQFESQGQNGANQNQPWHILARPLFPCKQGKELQLTLCACTSRWTTIRKTKICLTQRTLQCAQRTNFGALEGETMLCPRWFPASKMRMMAATSSTGSGCAGHACMNEGRIRERDAGGFCGWSAGRTAGGWTDEAQR